MSINFEITDKYTNERKKYHTTIKKRRGSNKGGRGKVNRLTLKGK